MKMIARASESTALARLAISNSLVSCRQRKLVGVLTWQLRRSYYLQAMMNRLRQNPDVKSSQPAATLSCRSGRLRAMRRSGTSLSPDWRRRLPI
jgi:hypothetical protein